MRIRIDFYDSCKSYGESVWAAIDIRDSYNEEENNFEEVKVKLDNLGEGIKNHLNDNYFNGADNAVRYMGFDLDAEYFEYEIMPN